MTRNTSISICMTAILACAACSPADKAPVAAASASWDAYWASVKVDPPPPKNFLDVDYSGRIENLTDGKISDETARKWVLADIRRGVGDAYVSLNLREDIANADIFGPPIPIPASRTT
jgi:hypothetical protein